MTVWLKTLLPAEDLGWSPAHTSLPTVQPVLGSDALFRPPLASHAAGTHTDTWAKLLVKISTPRALNENGAPGLLCELPLVESFGKA